MRRLFCKLEVKAQGLTLELLSKLQDSNLGEDSGIPSVVVKYVDIGRNTGGVSGYLDEY